MTTPATTPRADLLANPKWLAAVAKTCERLDKILSGSDTLKVHIEDNTHAALKGVPAFQNFGDLYLVPKEIRTMVTDPDDEEEVLPLLIALDLHELGHFEYSPRPDNAVFMKTASTDGYAVYSQILRALNGLEDQRQELLLTTRYPKARDYFRLVNLRAMFQLHKMARGIPPENFLLYYGRRHMLPRPLIDRLEAQLIGKYGQAAVDEGKTLIDEYLRISATNDAALQRMWDIAKRVMELFTLDSQQDMRQPCMERSRIGARQGKRQQDKASKDAAKVLDEVDRQQSAKDVQDNNGTSKDEGDDESANERANDDGSDLEGEDSDEDSNDDGDGDGIGSQSDMSKDLRDYITKAFGKVASDTGNRSQEIRMQTYGVAAQRLSRILKEVATDLKPVDHSRITSGKFDVRRVSALIGQGDNQVFRRRQESLESEAAMGVHIMCDVSGSMGNVLHTALDATATIAKAATLAGHFSKVSTFASWSATSKEWSDDELKPNTECGGGTNPLSLLEGTYKDFQRAGHEFKFRNFVVILITDGQFSSASECAEEFRKLHAKGVNVLLVGINTPVSGQYVSDGKVTIRRVEDLESHMRTYLKKVAVNITRRVVRQFN